MSPAIKCLILLAVVALFFVTELIPLAITAMAGAIACGLMGLIPAKQVFSEPLLEYAPGCKACKAYQNLAKELIEKDG